MKNLIFLVTVGYYSFSLYSPIESNFGDYRYSHQSESPIDNDFSAESVRSSSSTSKLEINGNSIISVIISHFISRI